MTNAFTILNGEDTDSMEARIEVVNKYTHVPTDKDVYIGRRSPLGNIYSHMHGTLAQYRVVNREEAIEKYESYLRNKIKLKDPAIIKELNRIYSLATNGQVNLVCYCAPRNCHGEVIKKLVVEKMLQAEKKQNDLNTNQASEYKQTEVYHGTFGRFNEFSSDYLGTNTKANSAKEGFFFATNKEVAKSYASTTNRTLANAHAELLVLDKKVKDLTGDDRITASFKLFRQRRNNEKNYEPETASKLDAILEQICDREDQMNNLSDTYFNDTIDLHESAVIKVAVLKMENPYHIDAEFKSTSDVGITNHLLKAKAHGYDGVVIKNTFDGGDPVGHSEVTDIHIVFSKDQIVNKGEIKAGAQKVIIGVNDEQFRSEPSQSKERNAPYLTLN